MTNIIELIFYYHEALVFYTRLVKGIKMKNAGNLLMERFSYLITLQKKYSRLRIRIQ